MIKYAIVCFLKELVSALDDFRKKYDPKAELIAPHITLVFPFELEDETELIADVERKLRSFNSFSVQAEGTYLDPNDHLLHLSISKGKGSIVELHDLLYSGLLENFWRKDFLYVPHITIGAFGDGHGGLDEEKYRKASRMLEAERILASLSFDNVNLIKIEDPKLPRTIIKSFELR